MVGKTVAGIAAEVAVGVGEGRIAVGETDGDAAAMLVGELTRGIAGSGEISDAADAATLGGADVDVALHPQVAASASKHRIFAAIFKNSSISIGSVVTFCTKSTRS
jgi:hypothetical protein